jgi:hypothetical protein
VRDAAAGYEEGSAFWKLAMRKVKVTKHGRVWARREWEPMEERGI